MNPTPKRPKTLFLICIQNIMYLIMYACLPFVCEK